MLRLAAAVACAILTAAPSPPAQDPRAQDPRHELGDEINDLIRRERYQEAIPRIRALATTRKSARAWVALATVHGLAKEWEPAYEAIDEAIKLDASYLWALYIRGWLKIVQERDWEARADLERVIKEAPSYIPSQARQYLASTYQWDDPSRALDLYEECFERHPAGAMDNIAYWQGVGISLVRAGQLHRASRHYEEARRRFPDSVYLMDGAAECHLQLGEIDKARRLGRRSAANLEPGEADHETPVHPPFRGAWKVTQGAGGADSHWRLSTLFAYDFAKTDAGGAIAKRERPAALEDYYAWDAEVLAAADGEVVMAVDGFEDRLGPPKRGPRGDNRVVVQHAPGEFTAVHHLRKGSVAVREGDKVKRGDVLGRCGSSGADYPHIHFVLMHGRPLARSRRCRFTHARLQDGREVAEPAAGDIVTHDEDKR